MPWTILRPSSRYAKGKEEKSQRQLYWVKCECGLTQLLPYSTVTKTTQCVICKEYAERSNEQFCKELAKTRKSLTLGTLFRDEEDFSGVKLGELLVIGPTRKYSRNRTDENLHRFWWVQKDGSIIRYTAHYLIRLREQLTATEEEKKKKKARNYLRGIWRGILARCYNENNASYWNYGGRGIELMSAWHNFDNFAAYVVSTLGDRPEGYHLGRINNDGHYEYGNITWVSPSDNAQDVWRAEYEWEVHSLFVQARDRVVDEHTKTLSFKGYTVTSNGEFSGPTNTTDGKNVTCSIHGITMPLARLIYFVFTNQPNFEFKTIVHLNGDARDNRLCNLAECNRSVARHLRAYNYERKNKRNGVHLWWLPLERRVELIGDL